MSISSVIPPSRVSPDKAVLLPATTYSPFFISGQYYNGSVIKGSLGWRNSTVDELWVTPFPVPRRASFDRISVNVRYVYPGQSQTIRLGLYEDNGSGYPGDLVFDAGTIFFDTEGDKEIVVDEELDPGYYWTARVSSGDSISLHGLDDEASFAPLGRMQAGHVMLWNANSYVIDFPFDTLPDPFPVGAERRNSTLVTVALRAA